MHRELEIKDILEECKSQKVTQVLCMFVDILGRPMAQQTPIGHLASVFERGILIDGSSLEGYSRIEESDLRAVPDPRTFRVLPWTIGGEKAGIVICNVVQPDGHPFEGDPRGILQRVLGLVSKDQWTVNLGPELEFFYFKNARSTESLDHGRYFELVPDVAGFDLRTKTMAALRELGIEVEVGHHEVAHSQHEIDLRYNEALAMADTVLIHRWVVKMVAEQNGAYATFMPKPIAGINGSGMHVHQSIFKGDKNLFYAEQPTDGHHLSPMAMQYLAGLLRYAPEITLVLNQWVNSYKRLVPGYEAPVYVCWGNRNRSALVRVPGYEPGREVATRLELRSADPSCNPYLAFACMIAAGLKGIQEKLEPPSAIEQDVYHLDGEARTKLGVGSLPGDLDEAMRLFEGSTLARGVLGEHCSGKLLENKQAELARWRLAVTDFELEHYLPVL